MSGGTVDGRQCGGGSRPVGARAVEEGVPPGSTWRGGWFRFVGLRVVCEGGEVAGGVGATGREGVEAGADLFVEFDPGGGVASAFEETETDIDLAGEGISVKIDRFAVTGEVGEIA